VAARLVARRAEPALGAVACAKRLHFFTMWEGAVVWGLACAVDADTAIAATIAVEGTAPDLSTSSSVPVADALALTSSMIALAMGRATALAITWALIVYLVAEVACPADLALTSVVAGGFVLHTFAVGCPRAELASGVVVATRRGTAVLASPAVLSAVASTTVRCAIHIAATLARAKFVLGRVVRAQRRVTVKATESVSVAAAAVSIA